MTQIEQTRDTIQLLTMRVKLSTIYSTHPDVAAIIKMYEIVIEELNRLLHYYENGTFVN